MTDLTPIEQAIMDVTEWISITEAATILGLSSNYTLNLCKQGSFKPILHFRRRGHLYEIRKVAVIQLKEIRSSSEFIGAPEAAAILGITASALIRRLKRGGFSGKRIGGRGRWLIPKAEVIAYQKRKGANA